MGCFSDFVMWERTQLSILFGCIIAQLGYSLIGFLTPDLCLHEQADEQYLTGSRLFFNFISGMGLPQSMYWQVGVIIIYLESHLTETSYLPPFIFIKI